MKKVVSLFLTAVLISGYNGLTNNVSSTPQFLLNTSASVPSNIPLPTPPQAPQSTTLQDNPPTKQPHHQHTRIICTILL
jgi:hypothetical protein